MSSHVTNQTVSFVGQLPDDPDHLPLAPPCGFIWMLGSGWHGTGECFGTTDVRVSFKGRTMDFVMTFSDVECLQQLVEETLQAMRHCGAEDGMPRESERGDSDAD
ncbi:hypothetical protein SAMN06297129_2998 [Pseudooceanicola antarcticus]|uniref:Uncharacterized protein n=1 Tax=Pseudooceanicola antarcticus TaxID=1247613 RepID=A0A285J545_9RHOB|nr:hypothetical protein [Pseudooceanicola antarcticus]PJE26827.1 hypothetical protein CVM39_15940 [Pseudooceanicola antarcticus]SNY55404.1 hypothetical protein SAMN06297129_2998 [Pseudooceanicola antarcticus]